MADRWLFFLDADGWLVGPESTPFPGEARVLNAALVALRKQATGSEPQATSRLAVHTAEGPPALAEPRAG
jgi:hypothetical protein